MPPGSIENRSESQNPAAVPARSPNGLEIFGLLDGRDNVVGDFAGDMDLTLTPLQPFEVVG